MAGTRASSLLGFKARLPAGQRQQAQAVKGNLTGSAALVLGRPTFETAQGSQLLCLEAAEARPAAPDGPLWEGDYLSTLLTA